MISNQKKLQLLELPETKGVLFDALLTFTTETKGEEVYKIHLAEVVDILITTLKVKYNTTLPKSNTKQIDLEDSIKEILHGQG